MKIFKHINPNVKWVAGVFTVIGILVFSAGYTINNAFSDDDKIIVKIMRISDGDTTIVEREFTDLEELEMLDRELKGNELHKIGMHMWLFGDEHDKVAKHKGDKDFKFIVEHGDSSEDRKINKKIIIFSNGDTVETHEFNFDIDKMHHMMAKAFHHIDNMEFNFEFDDDENMHFEFKDFDDEKFERKMEKMEKHIERAMGNFQFEFDVKENDKRTDCRVIVKSFPSDMEHMEEMMKEIIIDIKVDEDDDGKVIKHIIKIYSEDPEDEDVEDEDFKVAPKNQLDISELKVYPNPGSGKFNIEFELKSKGQTEVEIRDIKGGVVFHDEFKNPKEGSYSKKVNLEGSAKGVYILTVKQGKKLANKRLIIR